MCHGLGEVDAHKILKVSRGSSKAEIRQAYLKQIKLYHPDISTEDDATRKAVALNAAYEQLMQVTCSCSCSLCYSR